MSEFKIGDYVRNYWDRSELDFGEIDQTDDQFEEAYLVLIDGKIGQLMSFEDETGKPGRTLGYCELKNLVRIEDHAPFEDLEYLRKAYEHTLSGLDHIDIDHDYALQAGSEVRILASLTSLPKAYGAEALPITPKKGIVSEVFLDVSEKRREHRDMPLYKVRAEDGAEGWVSTANCYPLMSRP